MKKLIIFNLIILSTNLLWIDTINCAATVETSADNQLIICVNAHSLTGVEKALSNGAFIDHQDSTGKTALMHAAKNKDSRMVELLLKKGANHELRDVQGKKFADYINGDTVITSIYHEVLKAKEPKKSVEKKGKEADVVAIDFDTQISGIQAEIAKLEIQQTKNDRGLLKSIEATFRAKGKGPVKAVEQVKQNIYLPERKKFLEAQLENLKKDKELAKFRIEDKGNSLTKKLIQEILKGKAISIPDAEFYKYITGYSKVPQITNNRDLIKNAWMLKNGNFAVIAGPESHNGISYDRIKIWNTEGTLIQLSPTFMNEVILTMLELENGNIAIISKQSSILFFLRIWNPRENNIKSFQLNLAHLVPGFWPNPNLIEIAPNQFIMSCGNRVIALNLNENGTITSKILITHHSEITNLKLNNGNVISLTNTGIMIIDAIQSRKILSPYLNFSDINLFDDYMGDPTILKNIAGNFQSVIKLLNGFATVEAKVGKSTINIYDNDAELVHTFETDISVKNIIETADGKIVIYGTKQNSIYKDAVLDQMLPAIQLQIWKVTKKNVILEKSINLRNEPIKVIPLKNNNIAALYSAGIDIWSTDGKPYHDTIVLKGTNLRNRFQSFADLFELPNGCLLAQMTNDNLAFYLPNVISIRSEQQKLKTPTPSA